MAKSLCQSSEEPIEFPNGSTGTGFGPLLTSRQLLFILLAYFGLHLCLRRLISTTAGIDDSDQLLRAQLWSWGYGPQPPLYTWLLRIFIGIFGCSIFTVTLLKELLIFSIYWLVYLNTRWLTKSHACALAATAALQFNFSIAWEAQRELTHTVLASMATLLALFQFLRLDPARWRGYWLFGAVCGAGLLSKYNFLLTLAALLGAGLSIQEFRARIWNRKMGLALMVAALMAAPNGIWILHHRDLAFQSLYKLKLQPAEAWTSAAWTGLRDWSALMAVHLGPMAALFGLVFWKRWRETALWQAEEKFLWRWLLWIVGAVVVTILGFKATGFRDRYAQPLFIWLPVAVMMTFRNELTRRRLRVLLGLSALFSIGILMAMPGRVLLTERLNKKQEVQNLPLQQLAADLRPVMAGASLIVAEENRLGGNLRFWFPDKRVVDPEVGPLFSPPNGLAVIVWESGKQAAPPEELIKFAESFTGKKLAPELQRASEFWRYGHARTMMLSVSALK